LPDVVRRRAPPKSLTVTASSMTAGLRSHTQI
jgi:hypothetical protein